MRNTSDGQKDPCDDEDKEQEILAEKLRKSLQKPHVSLSGNAICTNPKCKTRMIKSNATLELNSVIHKAVMINSKTKIFILGKSLVIECICGSRYNIDQSAE